MGIVVFFIVSTMSVIAFGNDVKTFDDKINIEDFNFEKDIHPEYYEAYNIDEIPKNIQHYITNNENRKIIQYTPNFDVIDYEKKFEPLNGPMNSPWPMFKNNALNTGCTIYSTFNNPGFEKWFFNVENFVQGSASIDKNGIIYFGSWNNNLYAMNPDGSLKWMIDINGNVETSPAIDENGIIYIGTTSGNDNYALYAINPDGTLKWRYPGTNLWSSPVIANDGTIIFADADNWKIKALYPNGTLKWSYKTNHVIYSSPAINDDTVYIGCHDNFLYSLWLNNGSLKWKYNTGNWIRVSPCIGNDGTIYAVSLNGYLYAISPEGILKWKVDVGAGTHPSIGPDGTIFAGYNTLYAINPVDGSVKWTYNVPGKIRGGMPCISSEGNIYFGTSDTGLFVALSSEGLEKWRSWIGVCEFAPIINNDGTVYVGSSHDEWTGSGYILEGFLHAFGELDLNAPSEPEINGPTNRKPKTSYEYSFKSTSPLGNNIYYYVDWGDDMNTGWIGPYSSGEKVTLSHSWRENGAFTIRAKVKDTDNLWGPWGILDVTMPRNKATNNILLWRLVERFPLLQKLSIFLTI